MSSQLRKLVGHGISTTNVTLVAEKIEEWDMFNRFLEQNPDIKEKYETYKTFEILNNDH
jgi:hypothetical protein